MRLPRVAVLCVLAFAPVLASAAVTVTFADSDRFTDVRDRGSDADRVKEELKEFLGKLGERYLPSGTDARIEVYDVDRAGRPHMTRHDVRFMTGRADPPCIELAVAVTGSSPKRERVCDLDYLRSLPPPFNRDDFLVYEKRMLEEWFRKTFSRR